MNDYLDKIDKLYSLQGVGIKLGLDQICELLDSLGNPEKSLKFMHVAGTNGKGSVCAILASALKGVGFKVGFYSSPHLVSLRERFRINGRGIPREKLAELIDEVWPVVEKMYSQNKNVTFFEVSVAIAALYFAREKCDFVLWETGLGGRLDSTNIVLPIITAITGIGLDHVKYLGDTEDKIAYEKAGIIKDNVPVFVGKMSSSPFNVIKDVANQKGVLFFSAEEQKLSFCKKNNGNTLSGWWFSDDLSTKIYDKADDDLFYLPLLGDAQPNNMKLAYAVLEYMSQEFNFSLKEALKSIKTLKWHGRIQQFPDGKILDGSHNPQGTSSLVRTLQETFDNEKFIVIFGCLEERNPETAITILSQIAERFIFVPIKSSRACFSPRESLRIAKKVAPAIPAFVADSLKSALEVTETENKKVLITGSLYLAGETLLEYYTEDEIVDI